MESKPHSNLIPTLSIFRVQEKNILADNVGFYLSSVLLGTEMAKKSPHPILFCKERPRPAELRWDSHSPRTRRGTDAPNFHSSPHQWRADFWAHWPPETKCLLTRLGLRCSSSHRLLDCVAHPELGPVDNAASITLLPEIRLAWGWNDL